MQMSTASVGESMKVPNPDHFMFMVCAPRATPLKPATMSSRPVPAHRELISTRIADVSTSRRNQ